MADVAVHHVQPIVADQRDAAALFRADMDRRRLAKHIGVANGHLSRAAFEFFVLWSGADDRIGKEDIVFADGRAAEDRDVVEEPASAVNLHLGADDAKWPDFDVL